MANNKVFRRTRNLFNPQSSEPYRLSRSRLENFLNCPRCFYLDRRLGIEPPGMPAFTLNSAVDELLKKEFDIYRKQRKPHPIMKAAGIEAVPFSHPLMDEWRENFKGVQFHHRPTNLIISGAVDDLWVDKQGLLFVVDYKSTSTAEPITLDSEYRQAYKRQMEIYQWLLRQHSFKVSEIGYFVYCNADKNKPVFDGKLEFSIEIIPYQGQDDWIGSTIEAAHHCLKGEHLPEYTENCGYCNYRKVTRSLEEECRQKVQLQGELF